jgi:hypothetical protein
MTLTQLEEELAEGHGLAIAATAVTDKVAALVDDELLLTELGTMHREAEETRARCLAAEASFGATLADELLAHANTASEKASDLAAAWFSAGTGPLAAWSFLTMSEAGEVAVWSAVATMAQRLPDGRVRELASWALEVQTRHLEAALAGAIRLAELSDPVAPRWG